MCGFVGIASTESCTDRSWLLSAREAISHRGPDDAGEWWSEDFCVGLGHRRLSIVDLSPLGHQPMVDDEGGLAIAFNGEIYNHKELRAELSSRGYRFRSASDTEVLLAAYSVWQDDCLARLNGMFAFALFDRQRRRLLLARDRAGEKPLFFRWDGRALYFASELKAMLANPRLPRRIDAAALDSFLAMGYVPGRQCILAGYGKLPAAHAMCFDLGEGAVREWRYWAPPEPGPESVPHAQDEALLDELEFLLEDSVRRQLIADVPVGVLLSGGVDSSLITAMAVRRSSDVRTFNIRFPGHGHHDETEHARLIARHFDTDHSELVAEPVSAELVPVLARQYDEPIIDSSMLPTFMVSQLVRQQCKVALGGDGGDELFGGYTEYSRLLRLQRFAGVVPRPLRRLVAGAAARILPIGFARSNVRTWLMAVGADFDRDVPLVAGFFDRITRTRLMSREPAWTLAAEHTRRERIPAQRDLLQRATRLDFTDYLAEDILVKVDRASMLNSLELRAPLLDHRLIEFAYGRVPSRLKASANSRKILLKRLCARVLPPAFDMDRKQGFSIPIADWLSQGPFRDLVWDVLTDPGCLFDRKCVRRMLLGQDRHLRNGERMFGLTFFELWRRHYGTSL